MGSLTVQCNYDNEVVVASIKAGRIKETYKVHLLRGLFSVRTSFAAQLLHHIFQVN